MKVQYRSLYLTSISRTYSPVLFSFVSKILFMQLSMKVWVVLCCSCLIRHLNCSSVCILGHSFSARLALGCFNSNDQKSRESQYVAENFGKMGPTTILHVYLKQDVCWNHNYKFSYATIFNKAGCDIFLSIFGPWPASLHSEWKIWDARHDILKCIGQKAVLSW